MRPHKVPAECWEKVAIDLIGPMPSSKHIIMVQDLASRFPYAKLEYSTTGDKVIPVLANIYDTYGNPDIQLSDNGPPFNTKKMHEFAKKEDIQLETVPPHYPSSNLVEICDPLGNPLKFHAETRKINSRPHSKL